MRFTDKVVAISGARGGIGTALTRRFLDEGAKVFAADQDQASVDRLVAGLGEDREVFTHTMDVSSEEACGEFAHHIADHAGSLDILINNAGYFPSRAFEEMTYAEDVVGAVTFLASADAAFITGQIINVDGGVTKH
jgi:NAD(P)-dependent dehydrogenase (short-subunit alcohol dehydrogenase family)